MVDTSVVVAAFASWHDAHEAAHAALSLGPSLTAHEAYSVLTRLPPPHRAPTQIVNTFLTARFSGPWLTLPEEEHRRLLLELTTSGVRGGATYDALIGWTAAHHAASSVTLDARAASTYEALRVEYELLA